MTPIKQSYFHWILHETCKEWSLCEEINISSFFRVGRSWALQFGNIRVVQNIQHQWEGNQDFWLKVMKTLLKDFKCGSGNKYAQSSLPMNSKMLISTLQWTKSYVRFRIKMKTPIHKLVTIIEDAYLEGERWKMPRCRNPSVLPRSIVINRCV